MCRKPFGQELAHFTGQPAHSLHAKLSFGHFRHISPAGLIPIMKAGRRGSPWRARGCAPPPHRFIGENGAGILRQELPAGNQAARSLSARQIAFGVHCPIFTVTLISFFLRAGAGPPGAHAVARHPLIAERKLAWMFCAAKLQAVLYSGRPTPLSVKRYTVFSFNADPNIRAH